MLRRAPVGAGLVLASSMLHAACTSGGSNEHDSPRAAVPERATGRVVGIVRWEGPVPVRETYDVSGCPEVARLRTEPLLSETIVVNPNGTVHSALVQVELEERVPPPSEPARLEVVKGRLEPHLLGVQVGQRLELHNADPHLTNLHVIAAVNAEVNYALVEGSSKTIRFDDPEPGFVRVKSDVHPWIVSWIAVVPHPWFAITGDDGTYEIAGVPAGARTLLLRHPKLGLQRVTITIAPSATVTQDFTLSLPGR